MLAYIYSKKTGELIQTLDTKDESCYGLPPCGGCVNCLLQQAYHYGYYIEYKETK